MKSDHFKINEFSPCLLLRTVCLLFGNFGCFLYRLLLSNGYNYFFMVSVSFTYIYRPEICATGRKKKQKSIINKLLHNSNHLFFFIFMIIIFLLMPLYTVFLFAVYKHNANYITCLWLYLYTVI